MQQTPLNLVLIGMPGSGKSSIGVILAKRTSRDFVDTDLLIQSSQQKSLQEIVDTKGYIALRRIEEKILLGLWLQNHVIATGGSAAYSDPAMMHLKTNGMMIFLDVELATLETRISDFRTRGIAKRPDQSFADLYDERFVLYSKYADIVIKCSTMSHEQVCERIMAEVRKIEEDKCLEKKQ